MTKGIDFPIAISTSYLIIIPNVLTNNKKRWVIIKTFIPYLKSLFAPSLFTASQVATPKCSPQIF